VSSHERIPTFQDRVGELAGTNVLPMVRIVWTPPSVYSGWLLAGLRDMAVADGVPGADAALELSMGMSGDFADAIAEGATIVRIGSAVFGRRPAT